MERGQRRAITFLDAMPGDGERRLMLAVLLDAIRIVRTHCPSVLRARGSRVWERERDWFEADDRSTPFSFTSICEALGLNPAYVRRRALQSSDNEHPVRRVIHVCTRKAS
jgi:hypothetical protein